MSQPAKQPENEKRIHPLFKPTQTEEPSLGETLLPFLFAAMEACWIDAILIGLTGFDLFQTNSAPVPLWAPFVLLLGPQFILTLLQLRAAKTPSSENDSSTKTTIPGAPLFILFISITTLFIIWSTLYSQATVFFDPRWIFSLLNDILLFNHQAYHLFSIVALSIFLCWRSVRLLYREYEPSQVFGELRLGMGVIIAVILVRAGQANAQLPLNNESLLLLLVPIFLFLSLSAHALARISFVRRNHPTGLEGDVSTHERNVLMTIAIVGVILFLVAWLVGTTVSSTILADTQQLSAILLQAYDIFAAALAFVIAILVTPLFWLFSWWFSLFPSQNPHVKSFKAQPPKSKFVPPHSDAVTAAVLPFIKILLPILLLILAILIIRWALRRRRSPQAARKRRDIDLRESLFSWNLFWLQFKTLLRSLFGRFFPQKTTEQESVFLYQEEIKGAPAARSIREIYRALLKSAAMRGYPRVKNETPYEFQQRLDEKTPLAEPQLVTVTKAYTAVRYGGITPDEAEINQLQQEWTTLDQKWCQPQPPKAI